MIHLIDKFVDNLKSGRYNQTTIMAYRNSLFKFYNEFREVPERQITDQMIAEYLTELHDKKGMSHDVVAQNGKAIVLFYDKLFGRTVNVKLTGKLKTESTIETLNKEEIQSLLQNTKNIKHKALFALVYSTGMRLAEVIHLNRTDVDFALHEITIAGQNGGKTRKLQLAASIIPILQEYVDKINPSVLFFEGEKGKEYSARSIQLIFQAAVKKANIQKEASIHSLRHSYAVHLLERGIDVHYLKEILGHKNVQSTSAYLPFAKVQLSHIKSPMDY